MMQLTSHEEHESALLVVLLGAVGSTYGCWSLPGISAVLSITAEGLLKQFGEQAVHHSLLRKKYFVFSFLFCYLCSPREMF